MKKALSWVFWYLIANAMLENSMERFSKHLAHHLYKMMSKDKDSKSGLYCPICGEPIVLENMDALHADADAEGKIRISVHTTCLYDMGLDVCADCAKIVPATKMNTFHRCIDCQKDPE